MVHRTFILAYSIDNQNIAQEIDNHLSKVDIGIEHIVVNHNDGEIPLLERLQNVEHFIFLLVSDNFLKNINCINRGMFMIQGLVADKKAHPIIIDGRYKVDESNQYQNVPTLYDRMTHMIKYMNYWQDVYLEMRKERRTVADENLAAFDEKLKVVRSVSSEMGELLKNLRNSNPWDYNDFSANGYELFFREINRSDLHVQLLDEIAKGNIAKVKEDLPPSPESHFAAPELILEKEDLPVEVPNVPIEKIEEKIKEIESNEIVDTPFPNQENDTGYSDSEPVVEINEESYSAPKSVKEILQQPEIIQPPNFELSEKKEEVIENESELEETVTEEVVEEERFEIFTSKAFDDEAAKSEIQKSEEELSDRKKPLLERLLEYREGKSPESKPDSTEDYPSSQPEFFPEEIIDEPRNADEILNNAFKDESIPEGEEDFRILSPKIPFGTNQIEPEKYFDWHQKLDEAVLLINSGKLYAGLNVLRNTVEQEPNNSSLRYEYASFLLEKAESYKAAQREFEKVIELDPKNILAYKKLGIVAEKRDDFLLAKNCYEKALSLGGDKNDLSYKLGVLVSTKFPDLQDQAVDYFKKAIKKNYNNVDAHYRLGVLLDEHFKRPKKAARQFEITLELDHNHPFANYDLAILHHQFGQFQKASDHYARACEINPIFKSEENDRAFLSALRKEAMESLFTDIPDETPWFEKNKPSTVESINGNETITTKEESNNKISDQPKVDKSDLPTGKIVFISGATSGIGKATAEVFAKNGYSLILNGRREDRLEKLKEEFKTEFQADVKVLNFDVRNPVDAHALFNDLPEAWQNVDILINNAGLAKGFDPIHEGKLEDWNTMIDTNIKGLLFLTRMVSPKMVLRKSGHIINVCSTAGHEVYPKGNVYCATKHAVDALTKAMRLDLYKHNIKVGQVSPAHVEATEFARVRFDWDVERAKIYDDFQPLKSSDVADVIYFMASQPDHVNIQDVMMMGKQQANSNNIDRSGR